MVRTIDDIKTEILVRMGVSTTVAYYTDTIINNWIIQSHKWACSYRRWPFTEGKESTTYSSSSEEYAYPEGWRTDSIRLLQIGGKRADKLNFEDYQIYREEHDTSTERIFSDFGRRYFINPKIDLSGTITVWGQYIPYIDITDDTAVTVFSDNEEEGNEAMVYEMMSYANAREKKGNEAAFYHKKATDILDNIWERIRAEQFAYQTKDRGMFKRIDVLEGGVRDELLNEDQF